MKLCGRFDGPVLGFAVTQFFWGCCGSRLAYGIIALCILGSLMFYSGESSTQTLFLRVMDTFMMMMIIFWEPQPALCIMLMQFIFF